MATPLSDVRESTRSFETVPVVELEPGPLQARASRVSDSTLFSVTSMNTVGESLREWPVRVESLSQKCRLEGTREGGDRACHSLWVTRERTFLNRMAPRVPVHNITLAQHSPAIDLDRLLAVLLPCTPPHVAVS